MEYDIEDIERLWKVEIEILDYFDKICEEYGLSYSLGYGTLLGAIRHKGFIPWDDDIDVIMPRKDYNILLNIWEDIKQDEFILQNFKNCTDYTNNFSKIRKNHTTFIQVEDEKYKKYHKGIFIDIFPMDRVASSIIGKYFQFFLCALNLLYTKGFKSGEKGIVGVLESIFLKLGVGHYKTLYELTENLILRWNKYEKNEYFSYCTIKNCFKYYPSDTFSKLIKKNFSGKKYSVSYQFDTILKTEYADYMKLPPKSKRILKHHPILINFEKNYEELSNYER